MNEPQKNSIAIILAEDQDLLRKSFISLLKMNEDFEVIAEARNGRELIDALKVMQPDIVLLDIEMPVMNGMEALEIINLRFPETKVIMLTMHGGADFISEFMARGARAFLTKNCDPRTLFEAIRTVNTEGYFFDAKISEALLKGLKKEKSISAICSERELSEKEITVLKQVCEGKTNKEIAASLSISTATVDFHRGNLYKKTHSRNILDLLRFALKNGIISLN